jgi:hypothetical protein
MLRNASYKVSPSVTCHRVKYDVSCLTLSMCMGFDTPHRLGVKLKQPGRGVEADSDHIHDSGWTLLAV